MYFLYLINVYKTGVTGVTGVTEPSLEGREKSKVKWDPPWPSLEGRERCHNVGL